MQWRHRVFRTEPDVDVGIVIVTSGGGGGGLTSNKMSAVSLNAEEMQLLGVGDALLPRQLANLRGSSHEASQVGNHDL